MSEYYPDRWCIVKIITPTQTTIYKVLAAFRGGYLGADSWQINSGIASIEQDEYGFHYHGDSGSVYHCHHHAYGTTMLSQSIYDDYAKRMLEAGYEPLEMLSEDEAFKLQLEDTKHES